MSQNELEWGRIGGILSVMSNYWTLGRLIFGRWKNYVISICFIINYL